MYATHLHLMKEHKAATKQLIDGNVTTNANDGRSNLARQIQFDPGVILCFPQCDFWYTSGIQDIVLIKVDETTGG